MANVYLDKYYVVETHTTGAAVLHSDSSGNVKTYTSQDAALTDASTNYPNDTFEICHVVSVTSTDTIDTA